MHWKLKATIQNLIARLPSRLSYEAYYRMQRHFGGLRQVDPRPTLQAAIATWQRALEQNRELRGATLVEVGTGRAPILPLATWLMGADTIHTYDLNPYLKAELLDEQVTFMRQHADEIRSLFGDLLEEERFDRLLKEPASLVADLPAWGIQYHAPADAAHTALPDTSIDCHISRNVFEHIPSPVLADILQEATRLLKPDGICIHRIDYSDHFWHDDKRLNAAHFLQFSDQQWSRYADNRYMYMNRLRHDDYLSLFKAAGHELLMVQPDHNAELAELLARDTLPLDARFQEKSAEVLAITGAWIVSRPTGGTR